MVAAKIDALAGELWELCTRIHKNPELGFSEHKAARWLCGALESYGYRVERGAGGLETAFVAEYRGKGKGPSIGFIAEYDALPGVGHGCGHNIIAAGAVGAAAALALALPELPGRVLVIGTPGEENGGGKIELLKKGCFDGLDAAMMFHPSTRTVAQRGALAAAPIVFQFKGRAAHAASAPHEGINALDALIQTFNSINALRQHLREEVRIHGIITDGGTAANIVPERAEGSFLVRAKTRRYLSEVVDKVVNCARGAALATGASLKVIEGPVYAERLNNGVLSSLFASNLRWLGEHVDELQDEGGLGSSDMGNVSQLLPSIHPYVAAAPNGVPAHSAEFAAACGSESGRKGMLAGAKGLALTAVDVFYGDGVLNRVKAEFRRSRERA